MQRSTGISIIAIASGLGAVLALLMVPLFLIGFAVAARTPLPDPNLVPVLRAGMVISIVMMFGIAVWAGLTAYGLWGLRSWGRWSALIYSGMLAGLGLVTVVTLAFVPLPPTPNAPPESTAMARIIAGSFYGVLGLVGVFGLVYLNRGGVRAQFLEPASAPGERQRPVSITVIGWLMVVSALSTVFTVLYGWPAALLGFILTGWAARVTYLLWGIAYVWSGIGLLRLRPAARLGAMAIMVFGLVNGLTALLPGVWERMMASMADLSWMRSLPSNYTGGFTGVALGVVSSVLWLGAGLWLLIRNATAFETPSAAPGPPANPTPLL